MKYHLIIILSILGLFLNKDMKAQEENYQKKWEKVAEYLKNKANEDAEKEIQHIYNLAKSQHNKEQVIKSILMLRNVKEDRDEKAEVNSILDLEKELPNLSSPEKEILHSLIADAYSSYYTRNRWKIYNRTEIAQDLDLINPKDIETWTPEMYFKKIHEHYTFSLQNTETSKKYKISDFPELITPGENTENLHPTLYDVLVHKAIDYYQQDEIDITRPSYFFEMTEDKDFAPAEIFMLIGYPKEDIFSSKRICLEFLQDAIRFHLNDKDPSARIDADIKRIQFVYNHSVNAQKDTLYVEALKHILDLYPHQVTSAKAILALANFYNNTGMHGKPDKKKALEYCNLIIEKFSDSKVYADAYNLKEHSILSKSLSLESEYALPPGENILCKLSYRNMENVFVKIVPISYEDFKQHIVSRYSNKPIKGSPSKEWEFRLPESDDYEQHSTEIKVDALPVGQYALIVCGNSSFNEKKDPVAQALFTISNLAEVNSRSRGEVTVFALNRDSGVPIENCTVNFWKNEYNYKKREYEFKKVKSTGTDKDGMAKFHSDQYENYLIELVKDNESYWANENIYLYRNASDPQEQKQMFFFTDRAIYRPGQNIFFKGILIRSSPDRKEHQVIAGTRMECVLKDANHQDIQKLTLTTNEFGSVSGTFKAPEGLLNGYFTIHGPYGSAGIRIEEYKRPKFEVELSAFDGNEKLNEKVTVKGKAKAYAGNAIDGAKVKYSITRKVHYPYYWCFYRWSPWGMPWDQNEIQINSGETVTDAQGNFSISFFAKGDQNIDPRTKPFYYFEVNADVTDINGESRSHHKSYPLSNQSLMLHMDLDEKTELNHFNGLKVRSTNIQGEFTEAHITLTLYKLREPEIIYKKRLWGVPDLYLMGESEFHKAFPDYEYKNESEPLNWPEERKVWTKEFRSTKEGDVILQKTGSGQGTYLLEAKSRDKDGNEIVEKKIVYLYSTWNTKPRTNQALDVYTNQSRFEPGETAKVDVVSKFENIHIYHSLYRNNEMKHKWNESFHSYSINEQDRGGFSLGYFTVKNNRFYSVQKDISVPWSNKDLDVSFETFRDKIEPGSQQEWKVKISGKQKEKISAELLAGMYDASLDVFAQNPWNHLKLHAGGYHRFQFASNSFTQSIGRDFYTPNREYKQGKTEVYPRLLNYGLGSYGYYGQAIRSTESTRSLKSVMVREEAAVEGVSDMAVANAAPAPPSPSKNESESGADTVYKEDDGGVMMAEIIPGSDPLSEDIPVRTDMSETAFFYPDLRTDAEGNIILQFKAPEALTRWNIRALAHTKDLKSGYAQMTAQTQKELMVIPNHPRFLRENDIIYYSTKISNLSDKDLNGAVQLDIFNARTDENINTLFANDQRTQSINILKGLSTQANWRLQIPETFTDPVYIKIIAKAGNFSDGEQVSVPVLLNSTLVTETLPLPVRPNQSRKFTLDKLVQSGNAATLKQHGFTLEYTPNPAWYAVQALPYLTDYPYECAEQTFNRFYANSLAGHIANASPRIKEIFSTWENKDSAALLSNLEKNQELKSALLQETPWVLEAKNESEQKRKIAHLFDLNRMSKEFYKTLRQLAEMQTPNGGFAWFKGMPDSRFITQYIVTGIARLNKLGVEETMSNDQIQSILHKAIPYLDDRLREDYEYILKYNRGSIQENHLGYTQIQYLYMRSFFKDYPVQNQNQKAYDYFFGQAKKYWTSQNKYMSGMLAIVMNRSNEKELANTIIESLRQNAIKNEEMGMYWKELNRSYWWYEAPIEAHSLLIEAFKEVAQKEEEVDELKIWLLKQKQTQQWATTKATADACYALLLNGTNWLGAEPVVDVVLGNRTYHLNDYKQEAGTGYTKMHFEGPNVKPEMGNIEVSIRADKNVGTTWGAVYWQYFEQLDKITGAETPLSLKKQLYKVVTGDRGETLELIQNSGDLHVGDKVKVRIELRVDRPMEFVHMKDMRASCFEPTNVLSQYKYQNGLGYYESTKDASTQFFFDYLNPGAYIFEYPMFTANRGDFSNGICTIQCMYAPEFSSHSNGLRVKVE